jgi:putative ABC transport system permease protein
VASRRKEIALRMAVGARASDVLQLVLLRVAPIVLIGLSVGVAAHIAVSRWLGSLLYEVSTLDPITVAASGAALFVVSLVAAMVPMFHAISVDPARTLRED